MNSRSSVFPVSQLAAGIPGLLVRLLFWMLFYCASAGLYRLIFLWRHAEHTSSSLPQRLPDLLQLLFPALIYRRILSRAGYTGRAGQLTADLACFAEIAVWGIWLQDELNYPLFWFFMLYGLVPAMVSGLAGIWPGRSGSTTLVLPLALAFPLLMSGVQHPAVSALLQARQYENSQQYLAARFHYYQSLEHISSLPFDGRWLQPYVHLYLGEMLVDFSDADSGDRYQEARGQFESVLNFTGSEPYPFIRSEQLLFDIAYSYHQQGIYSSGQESLHLLSMAYQLYLQLTSELDSESVRSLAIVYFNLAQTAEWSGDVHLAVSWMEKAVQLEEEWELYDLLESDRPYMQQLQQESQELKASGRRLLELTIL